LATGWAKETEAARARITRRLEICRMNPYWQICNVLEQRLQDCATPP
jgi:hypothetical protein